MKAKVVVIFALLSLLCACSTSREASVDSDSSSYIPSSAVSTVAVDAKPIESSVVTTAPAAEDYSHHNEKGPFDDIHYELGKQALDVIDAYLDGDVSLNYAVKILTDCYSSVYDLPESPEDDPLFAGNDFVKSYIFLAYVDFTYQLDDFDAKKYEDRNYLAAAIGEPTSDFAPAPDSYDESLLRTFLDGLVSALNDSDGDTLYYYFLDDDGVFFTISMPAFDSVYDNIGSLSASDLASVRKIALDFVSGEFAEELIGQIRSHGGASKSVYITLGCTRGICMASCDLAVFMDELKK